MSIVSSPSETVKQKLLAAINNPQHNPEGFWHSCLDELLSPECLEWIRPLRGIGNLAIYPDSENPLEREFFNAIDWVQSLLFDIIDDIMQQSNRETVIKQYELDPEFCYDDEAMEEEMFYRLEWKLFRQATS